MDRRLNCPGARVAPTSLSRCSKRRGHTSSRQPPGPRATRRVWLSKAGFSSATPTYNGGGFAGSLFDVLPESQRPEQMPAVDELLRPAVQVVTAMRAPAEALPGEWDPMIVAVK